MVCCTTHTQSSQSTWALNQIQCLPNPSVVGRVNHCTARFPKTWGGEHCLVSVSTKTLRAHDLPEAVDGLEMHADWLQLDCLQHLSRFPQLHCCMQQHNNTDDTARLAAERRAGPCIFSIYTPCIRSAARVLLMSI